MIIPTELNRRYCSGTSIATHEGNPHMIEQFQSPHGTEEYSYSGLEDTERTDVLSPHAYAVAGMLNTQQALTEAPHGLH